MKTEKLTRPMIGIEYRTAQEVFDVMADRIRGSDLTTRAETAERKLAEAGGPWRDMASASIDGKHCILAVKEGAFFYSVQGAFDSKQWNAAHPENVQPLCWMPNARLPEQFIAALSRTTEAEG